ncbi:MAG TPA: glycine cleavage T C-terminal barrel domain-containing protein [Acidimicrobiales bacterium]|nr:glycine cleavage T C-terminal barrel domain-containing protein [Acidimicrobiales bacterium]
MADTAADYRRLREDVGAVWLARDAVRVAGPDALTFLDGQLSQDIKALAVGGSADSLLLQPQGKVVALLRVTRVADDDFVLDTDAGAGTAVIERLERFKLRTKATIEPEPAWRVLAVFRAGVVTYVAGNDVAVPDGVPECSDEAYEVWRIEAGVPVMGRELTEQTIPAEATGVVERAVSFTKGCYTGQELVARIDSRGGNVPRRLHGVEFHGDEVPAAGASLRDAAGADVGVITSAAWSPRTGHPVALAYVTRKVEPPAEIDGAVIKPLPLA